MGGPASGKITISQLTVHYTSQGSVKQKVLHTRAVYKSQTGEVVAEEIVDIMEE